MVRRELRRPQRKRRNFFAYFLLLTLIAVGLVSFFKSPLFTVSTLQINLPDGITCASKEEVSDFSGVLGKKIFLIGTDSLSRKLTKKFGCIENFIVKKGWPSKVTIEAAERQAVGLIVFFKDNPTISGESSESARLATSSWTSEIAGNFLVDKSAVVYRQVESSGSALPKIITSGEPITGGLPRGKIKDAVEIVASVDKAIPLEQVEIWPDGRIVAYTYDKSQIVFGDDQDINGAVRALQLIVTRATIEGKKFGKIDLRFEKPVVVYK